MPWGERTFFDDLSRRADEFDATRARDAWTQGARARGSAVSEADLDALAANRQHSLHDNVVPRLRVRAMQLPEGENRDQWLDAIDATEFVSVNSGSWSAMTYRDGDRFLVMVDGGTLQAISLLSTAAVVVLRSGESQVAALRRYLRWFFASYALTGRLAGVPAQLRLVNGEVASVEQVGLRAVEFLLAHELAHVVAVGAAAGARARLRPSRRIERNSLRRTYISIALLANNFDVKWVMSQVGHADSKMTLDVYAQLEQRVQRDHATGFDRLVRQARAQLSGEVSRNPHRDLGCRGSAP